MVKNVWVQPQTVVQQFVANEYVASSCGDHGTTYLFKCDAGDGVWGSVYQETNGKAGLQTGWNGDRRISTYSEIAGFPISGYHACGETHTAPSDSGFYDGYYCAKGNTDNAVNVVIWKGEFGNNVHCTTNLNKDDWETLKS